MYTLRILPFLASLLVALSAPSLCGSTQQESPSAAAAPSSMKVAESAEPGKDSTTAGAVPGTFVAPRVASMELPVYPLSLRLAGVEGKVLVQFELDETGIVVSPRVLESSHPAFSAPALAAVSKARFIPAMRDGKACPYRNLTIPIVFNLEETFDPFVDELLLHSAREVRSNSSCHPDDAFDLIMAHPESVDPQLVPPAGEPVPAYAMAILLVVVNPKGGVDRVVVLRSTHSSVAEPTRLAVQAMRFKPRVVNGEPVTSNCVLLLGDISRCFSYVQIKVSAAPSNVE